jgi:hypothetical protein
MAFSPVNDLERSLVKAATDPAHRPQFYRDFVGSEVFVIQHGPVRRETEHRVFAKGDTLELNTWERDGKTVVAIFSSLPRLNAFIKEEVTYIAINATDFLELTRGAILVLNPGSDFGKEFTEAEITSIIDGSLWRPTERWTAQKNTQVIIGQPADYPIDLVAALRRYFAKTPQVRLAYLAHFHNPERDEKSHTLIAIKVSGEWDQVAAGVGIVAQGVRIPNPPLDLIQITGKTGIEDNLRKNFTPFYKKKFLRLF